jgi:group II intron reverse transcriptase/maturase
MSHATKTENRIITGTIKAQVDHYKNSDGRYAKGLINIVTNIDNLITAYETIKSIPGSMTRGSHRETLDGIDIKYLERTAEQIRNGTFAFSPNRIVKIPKKEPGKFRTLGIGSPRQKIVQRVILEILEAIFEPKFSDNSHGFRPGKSCHTAIHSLYMGPAGHWAWAIEGDISKCFDSIPHPTIMDALRKHIACQRFLELINKILNAGYVDEHGTFTNSTIGVPQGSTIGPMLANIVLDKVDDYVDNNLAHRYNVGTRRRTNPLYKKLARLGPNRSSAETAELRRLQSKDPFDEGFKRMKYVRYADDFLILLSGSLADARDIKHSLSRKLGSLGLLLSDAKTKITPIRNKQLHFLGFNLHIRRLTQTQALPRRSVQIGKFKLIKRVVPRIIITAPIKELLNKLVEKGYARRGDKDMLMPISLPRLIPMEHDSILAHYNALIRGVTQYYSPVMNRVSLFSICRILKYSCALVLARKFKIRGRTTRAAMCKFGPLLTNPATRRSLYYPRSLAANRKFNLTSPLEYKDLLSKNLYLAGTRSAIGGNCAVCGTRPVQMHHIRSVKTARIAFKDGEGS